MGLSLFAHLINAQTSVVTLYIDSNFEREFGSSASVISADAYTTAYAFPASIFYGGRPNFSYTIGFNYTQISGLDQTWIYTTTENVPDGLVATCSSVPNDLVDCTAYNYGADPADSQAFSYTTGFDSEFLYAITITAGLEKLPQTSATPTSAPTSETSLPASPGGGSGAPSPSATASFSGSFSSGTSSKTSSASGSPGKAGTGTTASGVYTGPVETGTSGAGMIGVQSIWVLLLVAFMAVASMAL